MLSGGAAFVMDLLTDEAALAQMLRRVRDAGDRAGESGAEAVTLPIIVFVAGTLMPRVAVKATSAGWIA